MLCLSNETLSNMGWVNRVPLHYLSSWKRKSEAYSTNHRNYQRPLLQKLQSAHPSRFFDYQQRHFRKPMVRIIVLDVGLWNDPQNDTLGQLTGKYISFYISWSVHSEPHQNNASARNSRLPLIGLHQPLLANLKARYESNQNGLTRNWKTCR